MITDIYVSGFKSLNDFHLSIRPGLNVLVGPNGSGKSNILSLFELLSHLSRYRLPEAVSRAGGAGNLFRRLSHQRIATEIAIRVEGFGRSIHSGPRSSHRYYFARRGEVHYVQYSYSATIELGKGGTSLSYKSQRLSLSVFRNPRRRAMRNSKTGEPRWHLDLEILSNGDSIEIVRNRINYSAMKAATGRGATKVPDFFFFDYEESTTVPLFDIVERMIPSASKIRVDVSSGYIYNLNPNEIKKPEDIARPVEITQNGSGLAATLFYIQEMETRRGLYTYGIMLEENRPNYAVSLNNLKKIFCLINDNVIDIRVQNDALENKLVVIAQIKGSDGAVEVPLAMLSDGTVKWFSLVTAILSRKAIFSIEEPENFLHPHMQKEIVDILRRNSGSDPDIFSLLTTHSESLLNALDPEEVVVTSMEDGLTRISRSTDSAVIRREVNDSGFGLGYFYVAGALE